MTALLAYVAAFDRFVNLTKMLLIAMTWLQPNVGHAELALGSAAGIMRMEPLVEDDRLAVAIVVGNQSDESSLRADAVGDHGHSFGSMQLWKRPGLSIADNVAGGIEQLRISFALCKSAPFADYVQGPSGCTSPRARRLSAHRERLVAKILAAITSTTGEEVAARR